jgi:hypothetical protein
LTFLNNRRRYLAAPTATSHTGLVDIGSDLGKAIIIGGGVRHVAIGGSLFRVQ